MKVMSKVIKVQNLFTIKFFLTKISILSFQPVLSADLCYIFIGKRDGFHSFQVDRHHGDCSSAENYCFLIFFVSNQYLLELKGTRSKINTSYISFYLIQEINGLIKVKVNICDDSTDFSDVPVTDLVKIKGSGMFHKIEVHAIVDVHVAINIRKPDLYGYRKSEFLFNFFW